MNNLYIAGPMQGYENYNTAAFDEVARAVESSFDLVFNPAQSERSKEVVAKGRMTNEDYRACMKEDLSWIADNATHIYMLKGWENSKGARAEHALAVCLGLRIMYQ